MDGVAVVGARIAEIQGRLASLQPVRTASPAFAGALADAVGTSAPTGAGTSATATATATTARPAWAAPTSGTAASTAVDADGVPLELERYGNGRIPESALQPISAKGHRMWAPAATAFEQLTAAAARDGVTIGVTDSYRTYDQQVDLARRKGLYSQGGLAARPGTSDHGWGRSLDLRLDGEALRWMRANAETYGFDEDVPRESWHWTFTPKG